MVFPARAGAVDNFEKYVTGDYPSDLFALFSLGTGLAVDVPLGIAASY
jgi:hypothetical protein